METNNTGCQHHSKDGTCCTTRNAPHSAIVLRYTGGGPVVANMTFAEETFRMCSRHARLWVKSGEELI
jgi:hypothetical protein